MAARMSRAATLSLVLLLTAGSLLAARPDDPRLPLVELRFDGKDTEALQALQELESAQPELKNSMALDYLEGRLLESTGHQHSADHAYARALSDGAAIVPFARLRLAQRQAAIGHPEVAAGLAATALGNDPPDSLVSPLTELLVQSIESGGDCRLLRNLSQSRLPETSTRWLQYVSAECAARAGDLDGARRQLLDLLADDSGDLIGKLAADRVVTLPAVSLPQEQVQRLALALFEHREFSLAVPWLVRALDQVGSQRQAEELRYALARSYFRMRRYDRAAAEFARHAAESAGENDQARGLYQQARSLELLGDWSGAVNVFRSAYQADEDGSFAGPSLLSALRLEWRRGHENVALELLRTLRSRHVWQPLVSQSAIFLASSDIVRGRTDRAAAWLDLIPGGDRDLTIKQAFWRGRLAELLGDPRLAVRRYSTVLRLDADHPLAILARERLAEPTLAPLATQEGLRLASSSSRDHLYTAWLLLGDDAPKGDAARRSVVTAFRSNPRTQEIFAAKLLAPADWNLWKERLSTPEARLLALGLWDEGASAVQSLFPLSDPSAALTGIDLLTRAGQNRQALRRAEVLAQRLPNELPFELYPDALRIRLFPLPYRSLIMEQAGQRDVPPMLLAALIREESRFDNDAVSHAAARGLTQFLLSTARRLAPRAGLDAPTARDLHQPEIAISLGAVYLAELSERYAGQVLPMLAAYNAGEDQTALWRSYCFSLRPEEFYSKVGFKETRNYLDRVIRSYVQYGELYGGEPNLDLAR
jgi:soluble lytic murein transglycosylase